MTDRVGDDGLWSWRLVRLLLVASVILMMTPVHALAATYGLTLDYGYGGDSLGNGDYADTGFVPDWGGDLSITGTFRPLGNIGQRHFFFGNYATARHLNVELQACTLRIYSGGDIANGTEADAVHAGQDLTVSYAWTAATHSFVATLADAETSVELTGEIPHLTSTCSSTLRVGAGDYRPEASPFSAMSVKGLSITVPYEEGGVISLPTPTRPGHVFSGWYTQETGGAKVTDGATMPAQDTTYYARWDVVGYEIAYAGLEGATLGTSYPDEATYGETFAVSRPSKSGYHFVGWQVTGMDGDSHQMGSAFVADDDVTSRALTFGNLRSTPGTVTFTALWSKVWNLTLDYGDLGDAFAMGTSMSTGVCPDWDRNLTITGTFKLLDGDGMRYLLFGSHPRTMHANLEVTAGQRLRFYAGRDVKSGGHVGSGATLDLSFSWNSTANAYAISATGLTASASLAGTWAELVGAAPDALLVGAADYRGYDTFSAMAVQALAITRPLEPGATLQLPELERPGYDFVGWYTAREGGTRVGDDDTMPNADTTYYARWGAHSYTLAYAGMEGASHGREHPVEARCGESFMVSAPTRPGYVFAGWNLSGMDGGSHVCGDVVTKATTLAGSTATDFRDLRVTEGTVTFTATWTPAVYLLTYELNGGAGSLDDAGVTYGTSTTLASGDGLSRTYLRFLGWSLDSGALRPSWRGREVVPVGALAGVA